MRDELIRAAQDKMSAKTNAEAASKSTLCLGTWVWSAGKIALEFADRIAGIRAKQTSQKTW
jgi:hypothetical protein